MPMKNPPGEIIRDLTIELLNLTVTQAATGLGVSRKTLSLLLNGRAGISPEMAFACPKSSDARPQRGWLWLQMHFDLAQVNQQIERIPAGI